jgi:hypothetical protein
MAQKRAPRVKRTEDESEALRRPTNPLLGWAVIGGGLLTIIAVLAIARIASIPASYTPVDYLSLPQTFVMGQGVLRVPYPQNWVARELPSADSVPVLELATTSELFTAYPNTEIPFPQGEALMQIYAISAVVDQPPERYLSEIVQGMANGAGLHDENANSFGASFTINDKRGARVYMVIDNQDVALYALVLDPTLYVILTLYTAEGEISEYEPYALQVASFLSIK